MKPLRRILRRFEVPVVVRNGKRFRLSLDCGHEVEVAGSRELKSKTHCPECPPRRKIKPVARRYSRYE